MILVDSRVGSKEFVQPLRNLGVETELVSNLDADFQFDGYGPNGPVLVGVERKTVPDLIDSMIHDRLSGGQIGRMLETYDVCYLFVEGLYRSNKEDGTVEVRYNDWKRVRGNVSYSAMGRFLTSLEQLGGVHIRRVTNYHETAQVLSDLYKWWGKPWNEHQTAKTIYAPISRTTKATNKPQVFATKATPVQKWVSQLPGIDGRAWDIAAHFDTPYDVATADEAKWNSIKGQRLGKKTIARILKWVNEGE